jgi:plastocyanin
LLVRDAALHTKQTVEPINIRPPQPEYFADTKAETNVTTAGTYPYYCTIHPKMTGKVVVQ